MQPALDPGAAGDPGAVEDDDTLVRLYNQYTIDMVLDLKPRVPGHKDTLRAAGHKAIDRASQAYVERAAETLERGVCGPCVRT